MRLRSFLAPIAAVALSLLVSCSPWLHTDNHIYNKNSGNVGIGTESPGSKLTVIESSTEPIQTEEFAIKALISAPVNARAVYGEATNARGYSTYGGYFKTASANAGIYGKSTHKSGKGGVFDAIGDEGYGIIANGGQYGGWFRSNSAGSGVGIYAKGGTEGYAAQFVGNVLIASRVTGKPVIELGDGLDLSEGFDANSDNALTTGTVVVIDSKNPGKLTITAQPYDPKVAGIVTGANKMGSGIRLGSDNFDVYVALAGRVFCKVEATKNEIRPGDLLTTSTIPGYAMKASDYEQAHGTILGKAMEGLEKGKVGHILVLVTLQ